VIVDPCRSAIQTETEKIHILRLQPIEDVMEEIPIRIDGDRMISELSGMPDGLGKIGVQGGFPAQKYDIGRMAAPGERCQPCPDGIDI
jgi:hypothetical protein